MDKISNIVLTKKGKRVGYVLDVAIDFDDMQMQGFYVVDEESEGEFLLKCEDVVSQSSNFILIEDVAVLDFVTERKTCVGKEVMDENCQSYGTLKDVVFKKKKCEKFITDKCEIMAKYVKNVGEDFILVNFKNGRTKKSFSKTFPKSDILTTVEIQKLPAVPETILLSPSFYLGKISSEDIMGYNNEKIIQKGEVVTRLTVEKAKIHNKLNQLFFAVKR